MIGLLLAAALAAEVPAPPPQAARELSLDEALSLSARSQPSLLQAHAQSEAAQARADQARGGLLPQVSGRADYQFSHQETRFNSQFFPGPGPFDRDSRSWTAALGLDQLIYDFGATTSRYASAKHGAASQEDTGKLTSLQVFENVRTTFFAARAARELVEVAQSSLDSQTAHLKQIQGFVSVGSRPEIDLSQGRANVANAQVQLINARNTYATAKSQLNRAIGLQEPFAYEVADTTMPPVADENAPLPNLVDQAWAARPDSASLDEQIAAAQDLARAARGTYFPSIGASFALSQNGIIPNPSTTAAGAVLTPVTTTGGTTTSSSKPSLSTAASAQLTLNWAIFSGGTQQAQARESDWQARGLEAQREGLRQDIRVQVEQAQLAVHANQEALSAAREADAAAQDQLKLAEGRYAAGVGTIIELSDAQSALTSAAAQLVQAGYNLSTARAQLLFALGRP